MCDQEHREWVEVADWWQGWRLSLNTHRTSLDKNPGILRRGGPSKALLQEKQSLKVSWMTSEAGRMLSLEDHKASIIQDKETSGRTTARVSVRPLFLKEPPPPLAKMRLTRCRRGQNWSWFWMNRVGWKLVDQCRWFSILEARSDHHACWEITEILVVGQHDEGKGGPLQPLPPLVEAQHHSKQFPGSSCWLPLLGPASSWKRCRDGATGRLIMLGQMEGGVGHLMTAFTLMGLGERESWKQSEKCKMKTKYQTSCLVKIQGIKWGFKTSFKNGQFHNLKMLKFSLDMTQMYRIGN